MLSFTRSICKLIHRGDSSLLTSSIVSENHFDLHFSSQSFAQVTFEVHEQYHIPKGGPWLREM